LVPFSTARRPSGESRRPQSSPLGHTCTIRAYSAPLPVISLRLNDFSPSTSSLSMQFLPFRVCVCVHSTPSQKLILLPSFSPTLFRHCTNNQLCYYFVTVPITIYVMHATCEENCSAFVSFVSNTIKSIQPGYSLLLGKGNH